MTTKQTYTKKVGLKKIHVRLSVEHRNNWDMNTNREHEKEVKNLTNYLLMEKYECITKSS